MENTAWWAFAEANKEKLISLIENYHPTNRQPGRRKEIVNDSGRLLQKGDFITAPNAEAHCTQVRKEIADNWKKGPAVGVFINALEHKDYGTIVSLLNEAWFGVPESTQCWQLTGFSEACELLENPIDDGTEPDSDDNSEDNDDENDEDCQI